jgi:hypothetical protein
MELYRPSSWKKSLKQICPESKKVGIFKSVKMWAFSNLAI